jgi:hypothetical protein
MPVKLRHPKVRAHRITPELCQAWLMLDYGSLVQQLWLNPWWRTPIPQEVCCLGVSEWTGPDEEEDRENWQTAIDIQRALVREVGWPDCRKEFAKNLEEAEGMLLFYEERLVALEEHYRTGQHLSPWPSPNELEEIKQTIAAYHEEVAWRRELLRIEQEAPRSGKLGMGIEVSNRPARSSELGHGIAPRSARRLGL